MCKHGYLWLFGSCHTGFQVADTFDVILTHETYALPVIPGGTEFEGSGASNIRSEHPMKMELTAEYTYNTMDAADTNLESVASTDNMAFMQQFQMEGATMMPDFDLSELFSNEGLVQGLASVVSAPSGADMATAYPQLQNEVEYDELNATGTWNFNEANHIDPALGSYMAFTNLPFSMTNQQTQWTSEQNTTHHASAVQLGKRRQETVIDGFGDDEAKAKRTKRKEKSFYDAVEESSKRAAQPVFDPTNRRAEALRQIVAGVSREWKKAARADKKVFEEMLRNLGHRAAQPGQKGDARVRKYRGANDHSKVDLEDCDIVITTYYEVMKSYKGQQNHNKAEEGEEFAEDGDETDTDTAGERGLLHQCDFFRICLDEAHNIRNPRGVYSQACRSLRAQHRWAITGTPVLNTISEFYALFDFIRHPITNTQEEFFSQELQLEEQLSSCMLRRTHESMLFGAALFKLPELRREDMKLSFSPAMAEVNRIVVKRLREWVKEEAHLTRRKAMVALLRERQLCSHPYILRTIIIQYFSEENVEELKELAADQRYHCHQDAVFLSMLGNLLAKITPSDLKTLQPYAPSRSKKDKAREKAKEYNKLQQDQLEDWTDVYGNYYLSTKANQAASIITKILGEDAASKIIVYTAWLPMIKILKQTFEKAGWGCCALNGDMDSKQKDNAVRLFKTNPVKKIFISTLKSGGVGLNLTMAKSVINLDPWWNSAIEQQGFCRVYRIGQEKETYLANLTIRNTIEDKMTDIKKRKDTEIDGCMENHKNNVARRGLELSEIKELLGAV
ncbi:hypothetical protein H2203_000965 [Taxawa tesnikishii (nom. ined.)]|nr:hypothetical protein H2203_000965 [Dothideales sp. JES 119]